MRILSSLVCALLLLPLAACGNQDEEKATKALSAMLRENETAGSLSKKEADCVAEALVEDLGLEKLEKYELITEKLKADKGLADKKMSTADAKKTTEAMTGCFDAAGKLRQAMAPELGPKAKACLEDKLDEKAAERVIQAVLEHKGEEATKAMFEPVSACAGKDGAKPTPKATPSN